MRACACVYVRLHCCCCYPIAGALCGRGNARVCSAATQCLTVHRYAHQMHLGAACARAQHTGTPKHTRAASTSPASVRFNLLSPQHAATQGLQVDFQRGGSGQSGCGHAGHHSAGPVAHWRGRHRGRQGCRPALDVGAPAGVGMDVGLGGPAWMQIHGAVAVDEEHGAKCNGAVELWAAAELRKYSCQDYRVPEGGITSRRGQHCAACGAASEPARVACIARHP